MPTRYKIVVYVPSSHAEAVRQSMGEAGAGRIGNYSHCTFTIKGTGRFKPLPGANPTIGSVGALEAVEEERIETVCEPDKLRAVLKAIRQTHPYEEPATDVYPIEVIE
ncbi:MAG: YqfO family protein [Pseudolabrys sp.]|nr:YqfO family protein [Pseudolabrys sp.]MBV9954367.1 YqfO family protein [Pseudolabrys sp.]